MTEKLSVHVEPQVNSHSHKLSLFGPGHESGRKIVDILQRNPKKQEDKYTEEDIQHMRKVVSYCKRHLAQEDKMKQTKSPEELEQVGDCRSLFPATVS